MSLLDTNIETDYVRQLSLNFHKSKQISPNFVPSIQRLVLIKSISTQFYTSCNLNDHRKDSEIFKTRVGPQVADPGEVSIIRKNVYCSRSAISIGNSMICSHIWHKYHESYFEIVIIETILRYHDHQWYLCQISRTNHAIICLYYYPQKVCNFHMQVFRIKLKYPCSTIKLQ